MRFICEVKNIFILGLDTECIVMDHRHYAQKHFAVLFSRHISYLVGKFVVVYIHLFIHLLVRAALGITWPETISTAELTQRAKLIPLSRMIRKRRLRLVGHVIRMQSRCQTPLGPLLTTVPSNCHLRQGHGRTSTLQHNVADDLRSINCDMTSISGMTKSCFFNLVDTLD